MEDTITFVYCLCEDLLRAMNITEDPQTRMSNAEIMTTVITSAFYFSGNYERGREYLSEHGYIPNVLGKSRFNRRLNAIPKEVWLSLFNLLAEMFKETNTDKEYIVDSFPVIVCDNIRISRCKLYNSEDFRGYIPSKRRYFYGLRVHLLISKTGEPVEFILTPGAWNDCRVLKQFDLDLPQGSTIYADKNYNDYEYEDFLEEAADISLKPLRKKNSKRPFAPWIEYIQKTTRKRIETTASQISSLFPKKIHAVTSYGFELKVVLFIIAFAISCLW